MPLGFSLGQQRFYRAHRLGHRLAGMGYVALQAQSCLARTLRRIALRTAVFSIFQRKAAGMAGIGHRCRLAERGGDGISQY